MLAEESLVSQTIIRAEGKSQGMAVRAMLRKEGQNGHSQYNRQNQFPHRKMIYSKFDANSESSERSPLIRFT